MKEDKYRQFQSRRVQYRATRFLVLALFLAYSLSSCAPIEQPAPIKIIKQERIIAQENPVPGTVEEEYVEKMLDTVEVPGQLDPTGTYYRKPHKTIYEIRPGRYQQLEYPNSKERNR